jgi:molybdopterin-containing oxidoreductase family membrane subunit
MCFLSWALGYKPKLTMGVGYGVLALILLFALLEILIGLTGFQSGDVDTKLTLNAILTGGNGTVFWALHVGLGMVVPVILLLRHTAGASALASFCVMASFLATRWVFVIPPQSVPPLPGLDQAFIHERLALTYTPHLGEWLVVLFVFSLALLGFVLGPRLLPGLFQQGGKNV